uniref:Store-operated calcium entry-associated regulatory factor n=1 Tax=Caenorhabditis tropicalis TaxID=1561998 RepID=A0A1I7T0P8_9PELO
MTTGRRVSPTMQLQCVGGSAKGAFSPKVVQCANQGFDGSDVQWRCDADLPHDMEFGSISVSCEGYDYPDDPYILRGSCGLQYELEYTSGSGNKSVSRRSSESRWDQFATFVVVAFIAYVIYAMWTNRNQNPETAGYRSGGGGPGGPGSGGGGGPGGYPSAPPPYDDNYGKPPPYGFRGDSQSGGGCQGSSSSGGTSGSGGRNEGGSFWTGATLGAIGGYLANSFLNNNNAYARPRYNRGFFEDTGFSSSNSWASPSTSTRSSSGFGGTTRR